MPKQGQLSKVTPQEHVVLVADAAKAADVAGIAFAKEEVLQMLPRTPVIEELEDEELNLTSLIDCVSLLLIFFMVTTVFKKPHSLRVELALAHQATLVEEQKLVDSIDKSGAMEINRNLAALAELPALLRREKETTRSLTLIIRTDKKTRHGPVLEVMEIAKRLGIDKVVLATEEEEGT